MNTGLKFFSPPVLLLPLLLLPLPLLPLLVLVSSPESLMMPLADASKDLDDDDDDDDDDDEEEDDEEEEEDDDEDPAVSVLPK